MDESFNQLSSPKKPHTDIQVIYFIIGLCLVCGLLLAVVASSLSSSQKEAKAFDQSKQMLIAAKILNYQGYFEILKDDGTLTPAKWDSSKHMLVPINQAKPPLATEEEIKKLAEIRIRPLLADKNGDVTTLEEKGITLSAYIEENKTKGYANLPFKLFYAILPNIEEAEKISSKELSKNLTQASSFVFPVSGFGLWAAIYGFIAVSPDGNHVIGTTWYEHAETPGLGANISEPWWQKQFYNKQIFQESSSGSTDFKTADMGIVVVKGKVKDVYGNSPRAKSAVDGMSGATLTGDGVTAAYRNSLSPYRNLLIKLHNEYKPLEQEKKS